MLGNESEVPDLAVFAPVLEAASDGIVVVDADRRLLYANPAACDILGYPRTALLGQDFLRNFPFDQHPEMLAHFARSRDGRPGQWTTTILRPDGEAREISYTSMPVTIGGQRCGAAIFHEMAEENLRMARERGALIHIAASMAGAGALDNTLDTLAAAVVRATSAVAAAVLLVETRPPYVRMAGTAGLPPGYATAFSTAIAAGAAAPSVEATREHRIAILRDARHYVLDQVLFAALHPFMLAVPWDTVISIPMTYRHRDMGVLNSYYPRDRFPSESEIALLTAIADQAAVAVENARLLIDAQAKAALEERQRLARELHDSVSQALFGISLGARTARTLLAQDPARAAEPIDYVLSLAEAGLAEMRALIFELRPESLESEGLVAAITKQAASLRARHGLAVQVGLCSEPDLPLEVKEAAYRITQEALHNIVRHARATQVTIQLECAADQVVIDVHDNGRGFDPEGPFPGHLGLRSMRERATRLGGTLTISSVPGTGTHLRATIPIPAVPPLAPGAAGPAAG